MCDGDVCPCPALASAAASCTMMQWLVAIWCKTLSQKKERDERERYERKTEKQEGEQRNTVLVNTYK